MKISIVIPAFNEEKLLPATLRELDGAIGAFLDRGWEVERVVCDNNSTDRTGEIARAAGATVVREPVNQIGRARNTGAATASGSWLLFLDADSHPSRSLLDDTAEAIASGRYLAGGSTLRLDEFGWLTELLTRSWNGVSRLRKLFAGSFIFCEAEAFRAVGGFDLKLYASEEINLSIKLGRLARQRGKRLVVLHRHPLVTSARKRHLYTVREYLSFMAKTIFRGGATLRDPAQCQPWYDGRR